MFPYHESPPEPRTKQKIGVDTPTITDRSPITQCVIPNHRHHHCHLTGPLLSHEKDYYLEHGKDPRWVQSGLLPGCLERYLEYVHLSGHAVSTAFIVSACTIDCLIQIRHGEQLANIGCALGMLPWKANPRRRTELPHHPFRG